MGLSSQKLVSLVGSHHEIVSISDKLEAVDDTLVVKEHTSDLASEVSESLLDDWEDGITNLLLSLDWILDLVEDSVNVNKWLHLNLFHWVLVHHGFLLLHHHVALLLLLHGSLLLLPGLLLHLLLHDLVLQVDILTVSWLVWHHLVVVWLLSLVTWASSNLLMELTTLSWSTTLSLLASVLLHLVMATGSLHLLSLHLASVHALHGLVEHILEEVSLDLLETSVLTFLMEFAAWHPVLDRKGSSSEWS